MNYIYTSLRGLLHECHIELIIMNLFASIYLSGWTGISICFGWPGPQLANRKRLDQQNMPPTLQLSFFIIATVFTIISIRERFFTKKVINQNERKKDLLDLSQTTVTYETRKLSDMEFPVYFSLYPTPGYDASKLKSFGIRGEFLLFFGDRDRNGTSLLEMKWGTEDNNIGGLHSLEIELFHQ